MFRLALILLSGSMLGALLGLGRSNGVPLAFGFDRVGMLRGLLQAAFPGAADV